MSAGDRLPLPIEDIKSRTVDMCADSATVEEICDKLGIGKSTMYRLKLEDPKFKSLVESTLYEASASLLERMREIPFSEIDAQRARVQIDALARYLELRWPQRYGKRLDVTVKTIDMRGALQRARDRREADRERTIQGTYETVAPESRLLEHEALGVVAGAIEELL